MARIRGLDSSDITVTINGRVVGELQSITLDTTRESTPIREIGRDVMPATSGSPIRINSFDGFNKTFGKPYSYSGTMTIKDASINWDLLNELLGKAKKPENNTEAKRLLKKMEEL